MKPRVEVLHGMTREELVAEARYNEAQAIARHPEEVAHVERPRLRTPHHEFGTLPYARDVIRKIEIQLKLKEGRLADWLGVEALKMKIVKIPSPTPRYPKYYLEGIKGDCAPPLRSATRETAEIFLGTTKAEACDKLDEIFLICHNYNRARTSRPLAKVAVIDGRTLESYED